MSIRTAYLRASLPALLLLAFAFAGWWTIVATATDIPTADAATVPRAVSLTDARRPPAFMAYVRSGHVAATPKRLCARRTVSDVSAYRWNGAALGASYRAADGWTYWPTASGRVAYSGREFFNDTRRRVLVAAWCG